jgi:hypothetical protein
LNESSNTSETIEINYAANAMFALTILLLGYIAFSGLTYSAINADTFFTRLGLIALVLSILYVGLQIGGIAGKLRNK